MKLHFRSIGSGKPLIILHGVFGSSDNWQTLGKVFAEDHQVFLVDLRNHGNSPHHDHFDYNVMRDDVIELMDDQSIQQAVVLGHSMGGKVAMNIASTYPDRVEKLIVVDIAPKVYPPHHQKIFEGFHSVDLKNLQSRSDADKQMSEVISNFGIRQFILKNLHRESDGTFSWKLNLNAIENAANNIGDSSITESSYEGPTLFIAGGASDYILQEDYSQIQTLFINSSVHTIENAGHWVHAEKPQELASMVITFLNG